jgi:hypothetical protein
MASTAMKTCQGPDQVGVNVNTAASRRTWSPRLKFMSGTEMKDSLVRSGQLRALGSSQQDQVIAAKRVRFYKIYDHCLEVLVDSTRIIRNLPLHLRDEIKLMAHVVGTYQLRLVKCDQSVSSDRQTLEQGMGDVATFTAEVEDTLGEFYRISAYFESHLRAMREQARLRAATLYFDIDFFRPDGVIHSTECACVLATLRRRVAQLWHCQQRTRAFIYDAQEEARKVCYNAAEFLRHSNFKDHPDIASTCQWIEAIGDEYADHFFLIEGPRPAEAVRLEAD